MHWTWWITAAALVGAAGNVLKKRWGFAVWLVTNITCMVYDWAIGERAQSVLFAAFTGMAVWGLVKWQKENFLLRRLLCRAASRGNRPRRLLL